MKCFKENRTSNEDRWLETESLMSFRVDSEAAGSLFRIGFLKSRRNTNTNASSEIRQERRSKINN